MRTPSPRRRTSPEGMRATIPLMIIALFVALFVAACAAGASGSGSTGSNGGGQSQSFSTPPTTQTTPPVATAPGTEQPIMAGVPGVRPTNPGKIPAFAADDMASYVLQHGLPNVDGNGSPTVTQKVFLANNAVEQLTGYTTGLPSDVPVGYVELQGSFAFPTPPDVPGIHLPVAYMLFNTANGNIIGWGGLKQPSTIPTNQPTPTQPTPTPPPTQPTPAPTVAPATPTPMPAQPTPTPVPQTPPKLSVSPVRTTEFCANGGFPNNLTVKNVGGGVLIWNGSAPSGITLTPSNGTLNSGVSQTVKLSGKFVGATGSFEVTFTSNGGDASVTVVCQ